MVTGLDLFTEYFKKHKESYILIGGAATDRWLDLVGFPYRVTKDLDIILVIEALNSEFVRHFWKFIVEGDYEIRERSDGSPVLYRFIKPKTKGFPFQIELFSRDQDIEGDFEDAHLTPIPMGEELSSLSAILMDGGYYEFTRENSEVIDELHLASNPAILCLKAKAFLDINERIRNEEWKDDNEKSKLKKDMKKHRGDIFRIALVLTPDDSIELKEPMKGDVISFMDEMEKNPPDYKVMTKNFELAEVNPEEIFDQLRTIFKL